MIKKLGFAKATVMFILLISILTVAMGGVYYFVSKKTTTVLTETANNGLNSVMQATNILKNFGLFNSNVLAALGEQDDEAYMIRVEIAQSYFAEVNKLLETSMGPYDEVKKEVNLYSEKWVAVQEARKKDKNSAFAMAISDLIPLAEKAFEHLDKLIITVDGDVKKAFVTETNNSQKTQNIMLIFVVALGVLPLVLGFAYLKSMTSIVKKIMDEAMISMQKTKDQSTEMNVLSGQLASGAEAQAAAVEEIAASVEELSSMVKRNAENVQMAAQFSGQSSESAKVGEKKMDDLFSFIMKIATSSNEIAKITTVIDDIAFQTNLLALNASVEAARAGEAGRGFAVVADAVRALSQKTSESAKLIGGLIQETVDLVKGGQGLASESGQLLKSIFGNIEKLSSVTEEISVASSEQSQGISQISMAINEIDKGTQNIAHVASSVEKFSSESVELTTAVSIEMDQLAHLMSVKK